MKSKDTIINDDSIFKEPFKVPNDGQKWHCITKQILLIILCKRILIVHKIRTSKNDERFVVTDIMIAIILPLSGKRFDLSNMHIETSLSWWI